ncbi:ribosome-inactivating family protein [Streptomyces sp. NPDC006875]|uniref:ribosome-inactivating family protein n=1 Tax=Streptomyces sp. NPDC006875 TaxID=3154781 RepID=UPI00340F60D8
MALPRLAYFHLMKRSNMLTQSPLPVRGHGRTNRLLTSIVALILAATAFAFSAGPAKADTPGGQISHLWIDISGGPSSNAVIQYSTFLASIRNAAGHGLGSVYTTQNASTSLIRADINVNGNSLRLWISPHNLYLRGFTNEANETYYFRPDSTEQYNLAEVMQNLSHTAGSGTGLLPPLGSMHQLPYGGDYNDLLSYTGKVNNNPYDRSQMDESFYGSYGLNNSVWNLLYVNSGDIYGSTMARSLLFMIQYTSEASRFNDVEGGMRGVMAGTQNVGIPAAQQELENHWRAISQSLNQAYANQGFSPVYVGPHVGTLNNASDATRYLRMGLGNVLYVNPTEDWWHTEL